MDQSVKNNQSEGGEPDISDFFIFNGVEYLVPWTGMRGTSAIDVVAHLSSKRFTSKGYPPVPDSVWAALNAAALLEAESSKANKKRKATTRKEEKRQKVQQEYQDTRATLTVDTLYRKDVQVNERGDQIIRYDCGACKVFIPQVGFTSHVNSSEHRTCLESSHYVEDPSFLEAEKESLLQATSTWCEHCEKWILMGCWDSHVDGKSHRKAAGLPNLSEAMTRTAAELISTFDPDNIPVFGYGEQQWDIGVPFTDAKYAHLSGFKTEMCVTDTTLWGTNTKPGLTSGLVPDPEAASLGVLYTINKTGFDKLRKARAAYKLIPVRATCEGEGGDCITFTTSGDARADSDIQATAKAICAARGTAGSNYSLLTRIQHEYERQDWHDQYFTDLLAASDNILWKQ
eukprot:TRINITY_DN5873_c1_g1_i1.p1 TRINITY_DN5873_c1_g1~~TRINITY_DN5873_c1_g1_i1.p1  ORF type:complete len:418 (+),score=70.52 TRINITY_DN5873_c1_g1_i1:57-1256(+)